MHSNKVTPCPSPFPSFLREAVRLPAISKLPKLWPGTVAHTCNPSWGRLRQVDHLRSRVWDQPGQHSETPSLLKIHKKNENYLGMVAGACNPSYLGGWGKRITWTWEVEVAVSRDRAIVLQPGWWSRTPYPKKERKKEKKKRKSLWYDRGFNIVRDGIQKSMITEMKRGSEGVREMKRDTLS